MGARTAERCRLSADGRNTALEDPTDEDLITRVRAGDDSAFEELYRRHEPTARKAASCLVRSRCDTHDVVAEAFVRVLSIMRRGGGPQESFRPYLLACVRNAAFDRSGAKGRERASEEPTAQGEPAMTALVPTTVEAVEAKEDNDLVLTAFQSLPERWRLVLWYTAVEGRKPAEVAEQLELSPNGVAALAYRARESLREAYLQAHLKHRAPAACHETVSHLGAYVRGGLSRRERRPVDAHLAGCDQCRALLGELRNVNTSLRNVFIPAAGVPVGLGVMERFAATVSHAGERLGELAAGITAPVAVAALTTGAAVTGVVGVAVAQPGAPEKAAVVVATGPASAAASTSAAAKTTVAVTAAPAVAAPAEPVATTVPTVTTLPTVTPVVAVPSGTTPTTVPAVSAPPVTLPPVTLPKLPLPTITLPPLPPVSLPSVSLPPVTIPRIAVPIVSTLPPIPQLAVQAGLQGVALPGLEATLTVTVRNTGSGQADGTSVRLPLPAGLTYVAGGGGGWVCGGGGVVTCQLPDLAPGGSSSATIRVKVGLLVAGLLRLVPIVDASNAPQVTGPALSFAVGG